MRILLLAAASAALHVTCTVVRSQTLLLPQTTVRTVTYTPAPDAPPPRIARTSSALRIDF